jgi:hypothetical protein
MNDSKILFFFGAGASVPAGGKGVVRLAIDFRKWLQRTSKSNELELINKIEVVPIGIASKLGIGFPGSKC